MRLILFYFLLIGGGANPCPYDSAIVKGSICTGDVYEDSIENYKKNEFWGIWVNPIGVSQASRCLESTGKNDYSSTNSHDYNLNTAWVVGHDNYGIDEYLEFKIRKSEHITQFNGRFNIFNGYCKNSIIWKANSRARLLGLYHNDSLICKVKLIDTYHLQLFDVSKYLISERMAANNKTATILKPDDTLKFVVLDVYKGTKYKEVAISELLMESSGN